jgi:TonB-dependent SusC/RagA subfamily outer membrane receptor
MTFKIAAGALLAWATPLAAQQAAACSGPGAAFGVTAYQCASCTIKQGGGARTRYVFQAEPIVLEASASSVLKAGDVIEAINGEPIMTQAGADRFTYPSPGTSTITARRGNARIQLAAITSGCVDKANQPIIMVDGSVVDGITGVDAKDIETVEVIKGAAAAAYGLGAANGVIVITTKRGASKKGAEQSAPKNEPLYVIDGVVQPSASSAPNVDDNLWFGGKRFGFAIGCMPSCTRAKASDGTAYYKFDGYAPVVAELPDGAAERAGLRKGDLVTEIDGKPILGEDAALRFFRSNKAETLRLTVLRDGAQIVYLLKAR